MVYPDRPGYKKRSTSKAAANSMLSKSKTLQAKCLELLKQRAMTADEIATALDETELAIRPRISELAKKNLIFDMGYRRKNKSGRSAIVWGIK